MTGGISAIYCAEHAASRLESDRTEQISRAAVTSERAAASVGPVAALETHLLDALASLRALRKSGDIDMLAAHGEALLTRSRYIMALAEQLAAEARAVSDRHHSRFAEEDPDADAP